MKTHLRTSRRQFLKSAATAAAAPFILPSHVWAASQSGNGPNNRITLGFIGIGMMNRGHLRGFLAMDDIQVLAVCDVHQIRRNDALETVNRQYAKDRESGAWKGCNAYIDFRELIARKDIDAVVIATPDHWHAIPSILAARAKKDIYCEKPLSLTIAEARAMVNAARRGNVVFQTGSQQRTEFRGYFRQAVEYVRSGRIGGLKTVRVGVGPAAKPCDLPAEPTPDGVSWELWNGPAPERAFNHVLCPLDIHKHFPAWRDYKEYANGRLADMGAHHFDIAQWAMDMDNSGPTEIYPPALGDTGLRFVYANGVEVFHGGPSGCTFEGTEGKIYVDRNKLVSTPESILKEPLTDKDFHLEPIGDSHKRNWVDCIRSRQRPVADVEIGARTAMVCQLGNIGYWVRRPLKWDPKKEEFIADNEANKLRSRVNRAPWNKI
ncbi:MAG: Gfo/Idh/MocA family oxidoreductase [Verrucomicrobiota bacterium]